MSNQTQHGTSRIRSKSLVEFSVGLLRGKRGWEWAILWFILIAATIAVLSPSLKSSNQLGKPSKRTLWNALWHGKTRNPFLKPLRPRDESHWADLNTAFYETNSKS